MIYRLVMEVGEKLPPWFLEKRGVAGTLWLLRQGGDATGSNFPAGLLI